MNWKRMLVIGLKVILALWLCGAAFVFYAFLEVFFIHSPASLVMVKRQLNKSLTTGYTHISTERNKDVGGYKYREHIYHFEDENGVSFSVSSSYVRTDPFPTRDTTCSYAYELLKAATQPLEDALNSTSGLEWRESDNTNGYEILIDSRQELALAATGVSKAIQAVPPFPIKRQDYKYDGIAFGVPNIWVEIRGETQYLNIQSGENAEYVLPYVVSDTVSHFSFLCDGEEMPTGEQILQELQRGYDKLVEEGKIQ